MPDLKEYLVAGIETNFTTRLVFEIQPTEISKERAKIIATKFVEMVNEFDAPDLLFETMW